MRIGEVAERTGLSISNIRFYEKKGLIEPGREQQSKYRDYTEEDVKRLKEVILYRKMDFPIETISRLIAREVSIQDMMEQQLLDLQEKQKNIQGAIDLCEKVIGDEVYEGIDVENYLSYVKEEEAKGKKFAEVDDFFTDFAQYTQFEHVAGDPYVGRFFRNPIINRVAVVLWMIIWIAIPIVGILDDWSDKDGLSPVKLLFWGGWLLFVVINFVQFRKEK